MRIAWVTALLVVLTVANGASAQEHPSWRRSNLFISPMGEVFRGDADHTGLQLWFAEADADHNGRISLAEFVANADAFFPHVDANQDGAVTSLESTAFWQANAPEVINPMATFETPVESNEPSESSRHHESDETNDEGPLYDDNADHPMGHGGHGGASGPRGDGAQRYGLLGDAEPIMACDTNFDGRITKSEFEQCAAQRFVQLDANHDGYFTLDEAHPWLTTQRPVAH